MGKNETRYNETTGEGKLPFPTHCRICNSQMDCIPPMNLRAGEETYVDPETGYVGLVIGHDIFTGKPRTFEYRFECRNNPSEHFGVVVVDTPDANFRAVIRADRYDRRRVQR